MTDDSHPDRPARTTEPIRVARFDLAHQPEHEAGAGNAAAVGSRGADEPPVADPGSDRSPAPRVADFGGFGSATSGRTRVAGFDDLAGGRDRSPAPVIHLETIAGRRGAGSRRSRGEPAGPASAQPGHGQDVPPGSHEQGAAPPPSRRSRRSGAAESPADVRSADVAAVRDDTVDGGIPPDGPLPRGRRRRARAGRLGPDAPDPELPVPEADPVAIAREICLRLLTDRARTRQELAQALARKGVPDEAAAEVLDRFAEVGLIDDAAFAGQWVRSRHTYRGLGRRAIAVELRRKGVADGVAKEALAEVDPESEDRRARELIDRKLRSMAVDTADRRATAARRLVGMLARKGYGAGTAYRVVREALAEHGADADELGPGADLDG